MTESQSPKPPGRFLRVLQRFGAVILAAVLYGYLATHVWLWDTIIWPYSTASLGLQFVDMQSHLATSHAVAEHTAILGQVIPDDPMARTYGGPKWLFWLGYLGLQRSDTVWFTIFCSVLFLAAVVWSQRQQRTLESIHLLLVLTGPCIVLLIERGNIDLLVFAVLTLALTLLARPNLAANGIGWAAITGFIGFKYYPALAYAGLLESPAPRRRRLLLLVLGFVAVGLFVAVTLADVRNLSSHAPSMPFFPLFGGRELFVMVGQSQSTAVYLSIAAWVVGAALLAFLLGPLAPEDRRSDPAKVYFVAGASITIFSFLATSSPDYRLVHFLFCLPWLWALARVAGRRQRLVAIACLVGLVMVPWCGTLGARTAVAVDSPRLWWSALLAKQMGWWLLMIGSGAILLRMLFVRSRELLSKP